MTSPVTLESLALQNAFADDEAGKWEAEAKAFAASTESKFKAANGEDAVMKPVGGAGDARGERDLPLMERTSLPQSTRRLKVPVRDTLNQAARPWPAGAPVWDPRRGWLDPDARAAYEAVTREVAAL